MDVVKNSLWDMLASFTKLAEHWRSKQVDLCFDGVGWGASRCSVAGIAGGAPRKALRGAQLILKALHEDRSPC